MQGVSAIMRQEGDSKMTESAVRKDSILLYIWTTVSLNLE